MVGLEPTPPRAAALQPAELQGQNVSRVQYPRGNRAELRRQHHIRSHWWRVRDSNPRSRRRLIYSQIPLAAWVTRHVVANRTLARSATSQGYSVNAGVLLWRRQLHGRQPTGQLYPFRGVHSACNHTVGEASPRACQTLFVAPTGSAPVTSDSSGQRSPN